MKPQLCDKNMNFIIKTLAALILITAGFMSLYAQDCSPPPTSSGIPLDIMKGCRMVGMARVFENEKKEPTMGNIRRYLLGKQGYIKPTSNARIRISGDVLIMDVSWYAPKNTIPDTAQLIFIVYSYTLLKYKNKNKLIINIDGKPLLSENLDQGNSMGGIAEIFLLRMKYSDFLKFTEAKKITIRLGKIKLSLKSEDIKALNDLNETTKQLKPPPPVIDVM